MIERRPENRTVIYFKRTEDVIDVLVQVEGSKDTGFSGDVTGAGWTGMILVRHQRRGVPAVPLVLIGIAP